jgi:hypothetical protein
LQKTRSSEGNAAVSESDGIWGGNENNPCNEGTLPLVNDSDDLLRSAGHRDFGVPVGVGRGFGNSRETD